MRSRVKTATTLIKTYLRMSKHMRCSQKCLKGKAFGSLIGKVTFRETVDPGGPREMPQVRTPGRYHPRAGKLDSSLACRAPTWVRSPMNATSVGKPSAGNPT